MKLTDDQIADKLKAVRGWEYTDNALHKTFTFGDFKMAMGFINEVASVAEAQDHHPDIAISYNKVSFSLSTHDVAGVSQKDFDILKQIEQLAVNHL